MESISENPEKKNRKVINGTNSNSCIDTEEYVREVSKIDDAAREEVNEDLPNGTTSGKGNIVDFVNGKEVVCLNEEKKGVEANAGELLHSAKVGKLSAEDISQKEAREITGSELGVDEGSCKNVEIRKKDSSEVAAHGQQSLNGVAEVNGVNDGTEDIAKAHKDITNDGFVNIDDVAINVDGEISDVNVKGDGGQTESIAEIRDNELSVVNEHQNEIDETLHQNETLDNAKLQPSVEPVHYAVNSTTNSDKEITKSNVPENEQKEHALDFSDTALLLAKGSPQAPTAVGNGSHLHEELHKENSSDIEIIDDIEGKSNANNKDGSHEEKVAKEVEKKIISKKNAADGGKRDIEAIVSDSGEPDESDATRKLLIDEEANEPTTSKTKGTKGGKVRHSMCACFPWFKKNERTRKCSAM
eukprot:Seg4903.1 transcript_id=Seg4903.1/GoldUCD/mRNA.D3Y31 product="hypothetical protein" protein_id=Seg4903.1/GoldUCD/D3Y31